MAYFKMYAINAQILFSKLILFNGQIKRQLDAQLLNQSLHLLVLMDILQIQVFALHAIQLVV